MRRLAVLVALFAIAVPSAARAQMPDVRDASGIPRTQPGDPEGQLIVRVLQGDMDTDAFDNPVSKFMPGQIVHVVAFGTDGSVAKQSLPVDAGGRATFRGLTTDGSYSYYAVALLPRGGKMDRVVTRSPIVMPPQVGVRMLLAGLDPESTEAAVDDLSDPRLPVLGVGEVVVDVRGIYDSVEQITLREVGTNWTSPARAQKLQEARAARFQAVPIGNEHVYVGEVVVDGRVYRTGPLQLTNERGAYGSIFVYPTLLLQFHAGAEVDDEKMWFQIQFTMANSGGTPFDPGPGGIFVPLPKGIVNASVNSEDGRISVDEERGGFVWRGAFPPGQQSFLGQFALPIQGGEAELVMDLPFGAVESQLSLRTPEHLGKSAEDCLLALTEAKDPTVPTGEAKTACIKASADRFVDIGTPTGALRFAKLDGGVMYLVIPFANLRVGDQLRLTVKGLPSPPSWRKPAEWASGLLGLLFLAIATVGAFSYRARASSAGDARRTELTLERDTFFAKLVQLEKDRRDGTVAKERYDVQRGELKSALVKIHDELRGLG